MPDLKEDADTTKRDVTEFPIPVATDFDKVVKNSEMVADAIDRHLDFEASAQGMPMTPIRLCPDQRVDLISDLSTIAK